MKRHCKIHKSTLKPYFNPIQEEKEEEIKLEYYNQEKEIKLIMNENINSLGFANGSAAVNGTNGNNPGGEININNTLNPNPSNGIAAVNENGSIYLGSEINLTNVNQVLNSLKIPDAIKDLPKFNGNPRLLYEFIKNVEEILEIMKSVSSTPYANIILRAIRNKITDEANEVLNMFGTTLDWSEIKKNLILHYSDKRNETSLLRDLHSVKQGYDTIEKYYSKIIEILSTLNNHIHIHESEHNVITAKTQLYSDMCLNTFLTGIKEPLGSTIRAMKPSTLPEAFSFCIKEQNTFYLKYSASTSNPGTYFRTTYSNPPAQKTNYQQNAYTFRPNQNQNSYYYQSPNFRSPQNTPTYFNKPFQKNYNQGIEQRPINNSQQNSNQQKFLNTNRSQNVFASRPEKTLPRPTPMSVSSGTTRNTQQPNSEQFRTNQSNNYRPRQNFSLKEVHNINESPIEYQEEYEDNIQPIERNELDFYQLDGYIPEEHIIDEENF